MINKICIYDNGTGIELPTKVNVYPVDIMLGSTISEIHKNAGECMMFGVITHLPDCIDFVVPTEDDKTILTTVFEFGKRDYNIIVKSSSMWYNKDAYRNFIMSDSVDMNERDIALVLMTYLNRIKVQEEIKARHPAEMYLVKSTRTSDEIIRTPNRDEAISVCNKTACSVVTTRAGKVIHRTRFGKVGIPTDASTGASRLKAINPNSNGIFKLKNT